MLLAALLTTLLAPQEPAPAPAPTVIARLDGQDITLAEYQDFLWRRFGRRALAQYADLLLLRDACSARGVELPAAELDAEVAKRLREARGQQDEAEFRAQMLRSGQDPDLFAEAVRLDAEQSLRTDRLVLASRVATDLALEQIFEQTYGAGGRRVEVAHVLVMPNVLRAEALRAGTPAAEIDLDALRVRARELAEEARTATSEQEFAAVVTAFSHDRATREAGGVLSAWRPGLYGDGFAAAVAELEPGEVSAVVESGAGFHVIQLRARTTTEFAAVRAEILKTYLEGPPTWPEREQLMRALRGRADFEPVAAQEEE